MRVGSYQLDAFQSNEDWQVTRLILSKNKSDFALSQSWKEGRKEGRKDGSPYNCDLWKGVATESLLPRRGREGRGREGG